MAVKTIELHYIKKRTVHRIRPERVSAVSDRRSWTGELLGSLVACGGYNIAVDEMPDEVAMLLDWDRPL